MERKKNLLTVTHSVLKSSPTALQLRNLTQDGSFGQWAPWQSCNQDDGDGSVSQCRCRSRSCDGPPAQCGGRECEGPTVQVANCSRWATRLLFTCFGRESKVTFPPTHTHTLPLGMAAGLPGPLGARAAAAAASVLRCGSAHATTRHHAMAAESAWARVARRGGTHSL